MNSLDVVILIIVLISALIALNRGLIKEVLSIIGWFLGVVAVIYLLPYVQPLMEEHVESEMMAIVASAFAVLIVFFVIWIYLTSIIIGKVRDSKLSGMDRVLGLFFGVLRAFLLVILLNILIGWIIPPESQPDMFKQSKYFQLAGSFAEPIEKLIPQYARDKVHMQAGVEKEVAPGVELNSDLDDLFEKLTRPEIKKKKKAEEKEDKAVGYDKSEQKSLDRLIETIE